MTGLVLFGLVCACGGAAVTVLALVYCRLLVDLRPNWKRRVAPWEGWRNASAERIREFREAHLRGRES